MHHHSLMLKQIIYAIGVNVTLHIKYASNLLFIRKNSTPLVADGTTPPSSENIQMDVIILNRSDNVSFITRNVWWQLFKFQISVIYKEETSDSKSVDVGLKMTSFNCTMK